MATGLKGNVPLYHTTADKAGRTSGHDPGQPQSLDEGQHPLIPSLCTCKSALINTHHTMYCIAGSFI